MTTPQDHAAVRRVLDERARELAQVDAPDRGRLDDVLVVGVGTQRYAVALATLSEVLPASHIARVPGAGQGVLGIANVRGTILPVFTLTRGEGAGGLPAWLIVIDGADGRFALAVDSVPGVITIDHEELYLPGEGGGHDPVVVGITDEGIAVLDGRRLSADERFQPSTE